MLLPLPPSSPPSPPLPGGGLEPEPGSAAGPSPPHPEVRARLETGPRAAAHSLLAERNGFLQLRLHGYRASFLMSTLRNLAHFLEDDSAPQVLPMEISVRDTHVDIKVRVGSAWETAPESLCGPPPGGRGGQIPPTSRPRYEPANHTHTLTLGISPIGRWSPGQRLRPGAQPHHPPCGQSGHTQTR